MLPKFLVQSQRFLPRYSDREWTVVHGRGAGLGTSSAALSAQVNVVHTVPDFPVNGYKSLFLQLSLHINDFFMWKKNTNKHEIERWELLSESPEICRKMKTLGEKQNKPVRYSSNFACLWQWYFSWRVDAEQLWSVASSWKFPLPSVQMDFFLID